jgi:hypothetical protein
MMKITGTALVAAALLVTSGAFAGDKPGSKACCVKGVSNTEKTVCADLATLNLTADQKTKIDAWQTECMKNGCTKESRHKFLQQAKGILSAEQFAKLKAECKKSAKENKTET